MRQRDWYGNVKSIKPKTDKEIDSETKWIIIKCGLALIVAGLYMYFIISGG
ncbi:hypothetical protein HOE22_10955 [Candidatus Woesearchaeota archaeon]|jgi:hypothetical protein|nr:hypothetical protein [Candidatus Woesearchaeota archaeon]MBT4733047.1 hypothetical protein [Candidatus Woesearchaeota archaeon]MBT7558782.1 hypothetical protein [Candidatus Woesearchaeota archaeon]